MKELELKAKNDNLIMGILKVSELGHIVATTNKGPLVLRLPYKGSARDYRFILDAVPFDNKSNKELIARFFKD